MQVTFNKQTVLGRGSAHVLYIALVFSFINMARMQGVTSANVNLHT